MNNGTEVLQDSEITPAAADEMLDIEPAFREVAQKYGRSMFGLVMNAGMAGQAAALLAQAADKHKSQHSLHAVSVLAQAFNQVSNAYVKQMGWDEALIAQCDRDIQLAFKSKIIAPGSAILLDS